MICIVRTDLTQWITLILLHIEFFKMSYISTILILDYCDYTLRS